MMNRKTFLKQSGSLLLLSGASGTGIINLEEEIRSGKGQLGSGLLSEKSSSALKPVCATCGTQFPAGQLLPALCPICNDDRQYIPESSQRWVELDELDKSYRVRITKISEQLYSFKMTPDFAIGQRAFLALIPQGNILWDCIPLLSEDVIAFIRSKGGLKAIVLSHPHYYSSMNEWAAVFDCPVYINGKDEEWIQYKSASIQLWNGDSKALWDSGRIVNTGGHFPGSSVLALPSFSSGGTILCGDSLYIARSKQHVAVMHSYPNQILLTRNEFASVYKKTENLAFDTLHGAFEGQSLNGNAGDIFTKSMKRYINSYGIDVKNDL